MELSRRSLGVIMRNAIHICKCCLLVVFALITMYLVKTCVFGNYFADLLLARTLPLSVALVAISILFFSIEHKNRD